ncbi:MFS transporter [Geodermatophilus sp. CPCC 205761]|uniref:MFS transporter n=1 Tax=Geodermatophilus sp. CPCC 205761 TaxID=2936597 RepID=UPI003EECDD8D
MVTERAAVTRSSPRRQVLGRRDYRLLLLSFTTSKLGDFLYIVALVAYVFAQTGSAAWVSAAALSRFVPYTLLSPIAGVIADRYERRTVMAAGDVVQLAVMTGLTVTAAMSGPVPLVVVLSAVAASAATLYHAAASAMVTTVVPEDELAAANALMSTVDEVAFVAGPAGGALLLLFGQPAIALGINAATFGISALLLLAIRTRSRRTTPSAHGSVLGELREGVGALVGDRVVLVLVGCLVAGTLVYGVELVVLVLVSSELLGTGSQGLGWLLAASGVGGILGATLSPRFARARRPRLTIAILVLLTGVPLAALALVRAPAVAYLVLVVEGVAIVALDILIETTMQRTVPRDVLGRVSGLVLSLSAVGTALGTLVAPALVDGLGLPATLAVAGLTPVLIAAASLSLLRGFDAATERGRHALEPRVAVLQTLRLFEGAGPAAIERLAAAVRQERLPGGTVVLRQGEPAEDLFVLVDGDLVVDHDDGVTVRRINEMTAPDYLGEIGLVERVPRTATVTAATEALLWRIPGELFLEAVTGAPTLSPTLTTGISTRLARTPGRA